jgi:hypothetical protein
VDQVAAAIGRRASFALSISDGELRLSFADQTVTVPMTEHRIDAR